MKQVIIKGQTYGVGTLDALRQFHITRRIAPIIMSGGVSLLTLRQEANIPMEDMFAGLSPMASVLANMSDADTEYILATCLSVVTRKQGETWAPVAHGAQPMFADVDMMAMIRLAVAVIMENLAGFIAELDAATPPASS